jgi:CRISPR-associated protein Cmr4
METMIQETTMLYLYVETPLHAGTGSGLSSVDLPIQRERTTQYPMIQGSGIKGKLRSAAYRAVGAKNAAWTKEEIFTVFGPEDNGSDHAGALIAGDARILLFPVRSLNGVFAYTTSIDVLNRFLRDMKRAGKSISWNLDVEVGQQAALVPQTKCAVTAGDTLVLEEFSFTATSDPLVDTIAEWIAENAFPQKEEKSASDEYRYWREKVKTSLVILSDNDFRDFAVNATEIITRVRIKRDTKTVEGGALWTEEHLPTDTVLYVTIYATDARKMKVNGNGKSEPAMLASDILTKARSLEESQQGYIQLGGDETVGRGIVCMHWQEA